MNPSSFNLWMVFFLLVAGHGFFLASFLKLKVRPSHVSGPLSLLIFLFSISLLYYVAFWMGLNESSSPFWGLILTFPTLYGPLMFLYLQKFASKGASSWHFAPFLAHLLFMTFYYLNQTRGWHFGFFSETAVVFATIGQNVSLVVYMTLLFQSIGSIPLNYQPRLKMVSWFFLGFVASFVSYYVLVLSIDFRPVHDYIVSISMSIFMYAVGYLSFNGNWDSVKTRNRGYRKSGLNETMANYYKQELLTLMKHQRPYVNGDLKLSQLADKLDISQHNLSELLNVKFGMSFPEFVNSYRIKDAQTLMQGDHSNALRLIDIAYQVGYNNKTSFSQTFKKHTGLTPSQFRTRSQPAAPESGVHK